ncbi:hypothetical protein EDB92DRAFT_1819829 [Lactarius akahatsu]|uniref:Uncharacterized protein n=1 Tax=Lactarius akahatsu TaxID=416441 RepID=A0AAD4L6N3_9AGAM|nr:hypothetical protein EDB92DRAFT_1819829 [Lactarius akahatsu]
MVRGKPIPVHGFPRVMYIVVAAGQWRPRHHLRNGFLPHSHLAACEYPTRLTCCSHPSTAAHARDLPLLRAVTTSPQPQHHRTRTRCPSTLTPPPRYCRDIPRPHRPGYDHHLDPATLPPPRHGLTATSTRPYRHLDTALPPPQPCHPPRYDTSTSAPYLDPHWRHLDMTPTTISTGIIATHPFAQFFLQ